MFNVDSSLNRHFAIGNPIATKTQSDITQQFFSASNQSHSPIAL